MAILKRIEAKKDKDFKDRKLRQQHKKIVQEYEDLYKNPKDSRSAKPEPRRVGGQASTSVMSSFRKGAELKQEYQRKKTQLYEEARRLPDFPNGILPDSARGKVTQLLRQGFEQNGAKVLARLPYAKIKRFVDFKIQYENNMRDLVKGSANKTSATTATATGKVANTKTTVAPTITKPRSDTETAYHNNVKLLKKYEESKTINDNIKRLLLTCLKKVRQYEELNKLPKTASKFENLLPKKVVTVAKKPVPAVAKKVEKKVESKDKQNDTPTKAKETKSNEEKPPKETTKGEDDNKNACENENVEKNESVDLTEEENKNDDQDEVEIIEDENNEEITEPQNDEEMTEDQNEEDNAEIQQDENEDIEEQNDGGDDNVETTEDQNEDDGNVELNEDEDVELIEDQNDDNEVDLTEQQDEELENEEEK